MKKSRNLLCVLAIPILAAAAPSGAPPGYYYDATSDSYVVCPSGTYCPGGGTAPITDPGGTYSPAGATSPTTDPAGTYSSPYALNRLIVEANDNTPDTAILSFNSSTAVANYYGVTSLEASLANDFFAGYAGTSATLEFTRFGLGQRPHLLGTNLSKLSLAQLQGISGSLSLTFDGYSYSGDVNLAGVTNFSDAATEIQKALNSTSSRQIVTKTTGSSIAPVSVPFTGYISVWELFVTSAEPGSIKIGAWVSGPGIDSKSNQIIRQVSGTPGGVGAYSFFAAVGTVPQEQMTLTYGVLSVGSVTSGTVQPGLAVDGPGIRTDTAIISSLGGNSWLVDKSQTVATENMNLRPASLSVIAQQMIGETENNDFFEIQPNGDYGFNEAPSSLSFASGTAASALGLTQESGAIDSSPGGQHPTVAQFMNNVVKHENGQFGSYQGLLEWPALEAWSALPGGLGHQFFGLSNTTPPAGSSLPVTDPHGTYSYPGASAPTLGNAPPASASLTVNGQSGTVAVTSGESVNYAWSSTNAISASATADVSKGPNGCGHSTTPTAWNAGNSLNGSLPSVVPACSAGSTYVITYTAINAQGQTAQATLILEVSP